MTCRTARERLVAWRDGELGPSEGQLVREHVLTCRACGDLDRALVGSQPAPDPLATPWSIRAKVARELDPELLLALAADPAPPADAWQAWRGALTRPVSMPLGALVAYGLLLAIALGFGVAGAWPRSSSPAPIAPSAIPSDQFRPASYDPDAGRAP